MEVRVRLTHDGRLRYGFGAEVDVRLPNCPAEDRDTVVDAAWPACPMVGEVRFERTPVSG